MIFCSMVAVVCGFVLVKPRGDVLGLILSLKKKEKKGEKRD